MKIEKIERRLVAINKPAYDILKKYCEYRGYTITAKLSMIIEQYLKKEKFKPELVEAIKVEPIQQSEDTIDF